MLLTAVPREKGVRTFAEPRIQDPWIKSVASGGTENHHHRARIHGSRIRGLKVLPLAEPENHHRCATLPAPPPYEKEVVHRYPPCKTGRVLAPLPSLLSPCHYWQ
jgi:hypothetical protein